jgi:hypothetical protein
MLIARRIVDVRELFRGFLALKSLVVALAILALWGRSYFAGDQFRRGDAAQYIQLGSASGSVVVTFGHDGKETRLRGTWDYVASKEPRQVLATARLGDSPWNRVGFGFSKEMVVWPVRGMLVNIVVPHWLLFLLAVPSAARWAMRRWFTPEPIENDVLECPRCGQMFARVPHACPICGQALVVAEFK